MAVKNSKLLLNKTTLLGVKFTDHKRIIITHKSSFLVEKKSNIALGSI